MCFTTYVAKLQHYFQINYKLSLFKKSDKWEENILQLDVQADTEKSTLASVSAWQTN